MTNQATYNVAIIGQTGVGKSSVINYLYGNYVAKIGTGEPVTPRGFHPIRIILNGLPIIIYDSMGLEADKYQIWMKDFHSELKKRGADQPPSEWFHSVFYCINAGSARIQPVDIEIINTLIKENYRVSIILTKCDLIDEDDEKLLKNAITSKLKNISIISTSIGKKTRGTQIPAFGKEDIQKKAFEDFLYSLILRLPIRCEAVMKSVKISWRDDVKSYVEDIGFMGHNESDQHKKIAARTERIMNDLLISSKREFDNTLAMYADFSKKLGYPPMDSNLNQNNRVKFADEKSNDVSWYEVPFVVVLSPVAIAWGLFFGKSEAQDNLKKEISRTSDEIDEKIILIKKKIVLQLENAKSRALPLH